MCKDHKDIPGHHPIQDHHEPKFDKLMENVHFPNPTTDDIFTSQSNDDKNHSKAPKGNPPVKSCKNGNKWVIMYANTRGIKGKLTSLRQILLENSPHVFLITETQMRSNTGISINGYTFFARKREGKTGGGVGILVRNDVRSSIAAHPSARNIEILWISIRRKNMPPLIVGTYYDKRQGRQKMKLKEK